MNSIVVLTINLVLYTYVSLVRGTEFDENFPNCFYLRKQVSTF